MRCLNITGLAVTDLDVETVLFRLSELNELRLFDLSEVTDAIFFNSLPSLRELYCYRCPMIRNFGLRELLHESSKNLRILEVSGCKNVNITELVHDAQEATNQRTNGPLLEMGVRESYYYFSDNIETTKISQYFELTICQ